VRSQAAVDDDHLAGARTDLVTRTEAELASIDILVNNAAVNGYHSSTLVPGWQPEDLPGVIARQEANLAEQGWQDAYAFGRVHSPRPAYP
jgi:NAD(P)-dependent dehydrogenase (short-subunit alcohol dehydrogenase family)